MVSEIDSACESLNCSLGFMSFGSPLGMEKIAVEPSTGDGRMYNPIESHVPRIVGDVEGIVWAVDGLVF